MPLNNEVSIVNFGGTDNDIKDSYARLLIADEETTTTATHPYVKGDYFIWTDRQLYKAKTDIFVGDTLVLNTNVEEAGDVTDEISKINKTIGDLVTVTGNPLSFETGSEQLAQDVVITFEPIETGSGEKSPNNPYIISGYNSADIAVPRENQWDEEWEQGYFTDSGVPGSNVDTIRSKNYIGVLPNTTYYFKSPSISSLVIKYVFYDSNRNILSVVTDQSPSQLFTTPNNAKYMRFSTNIRYGGTYNHDISINYPSTDTSYHAYNPITDISESFPETIYGGTLDLMIGELVVDRDGVDLSDLVWSYKSDIGCFASTTLQTSSSVIIEQEEISEKYKGGLSWADFTSSSSSLCTFASHDGRIYVKTENSSTQPSGKMVRKLITPVIYHLTPHQVKLLQGANVVTTNGTSMILKYRKGEIAKLDDVSEASVFAEEVNKHSYTYEDNTKLGAHNLLPYPYEETTKVSRGVTYTDIGDGRINAIGTNSSDNKKSVFDFHSSMSLKKGNYVLSGCPKGGGNSYFVYISINGTLYADYGDGVKFHLSEDTDSIAVGFRVEVGGTISNVIEPMICDANDTDPTFAPYAMTNRELTEKKADKSDVVFVNKSADITITPITPNRTLAQTLAAIYDQIDFTKITPYSFLTINDTDVYRVSRHQSSFAIFTAMQYESSHIASVLMQIKNNANLAKLLSNGTETDISSNTVNYTYKLYY